MDGAENLLTDQSAAAAETAELRLLAPVGRGDKWPAAVGYAVRQHKMGKRVQVCLLHVKEPLKQWDMLRTPWPEERHLQQRIESDLSVAAHPLIAHGIPYAAYLRTGSVVFAILDAAEELDCHEIVVPLPHSGLRKFFSRNVVAALCLRRGNIPVVTVARDGMPIKTTKHAWI